MPPLRSFHGRSPGSLLAPLTVRSGFRCSHGHRRGCARLARTHPRGPNEASAGLARRPPADPRRCAGSRGRVRRGGALRSLAPGSTRPRWERLGGDPLFVATLPLWVVVAKLYKLYDNDEERADHSTVDDLVGVFGLLTTGAWLSSAGASLSGLADPNLPKLAVFWVLGIGLVDACARLGPTIARRSAIYVQNVVIVGAGDVGQLVARKLVQHPEYRIRLLGFVDADPRPLRPDLVGIPVLGPPSSLPELARPLGIERVLVGVLPRFEGRDEPP